MTAFRRVGLTLCAASLLLCWTTARASANEGAPANACPYDADLTVALGKQSITVPQSALAPGAGTDIGGYELRPDHARLVVEIIGRRGDVWLAPMTKLVRGKRCQGIYLGKPVLTASKDD